MRNLVNSTGAYYLDGNRVPMVNEGFIGAALLMGSGKNLEIPSDDELPYLFCGNGSCRDCNLLVDGLVDIPSCRVPLASGLSMRSGDGAGEENALSRKIGAVAVGDPLSCDVAVVGGGRSGKLAAARARADGRSVELFDARLPEPRPVSVDEGQVVVFERGNRRRIEARTLVLATGSRDVVPGVAGSFLPGVFPMDLVERYVALGFLPARRLLLVGGDDRVDRLTGELERLGAELIATGTTLHSVSGSLRVQAANVDDRRLDIDAVVIEGRRQPSLALAKALGCRTHYDRERAYDVLEVDDEGWTSVDGIAAVSSVDGAVSR